MELREITDWEKPIYVKVGGARPYYDVALAAKAGADVVVAGSYVFDAPDYAARITALRRAAIEETA